MKKQIKKLKLSVETVQVLRTVRILTSAELRRVAGGITNGCPILSYPCGTNAFECASQPLTGCCATFNTCHLSCPFGCGGNG